MRDRKTIRYIYKLRMSRWTYVRIGRLLGKSREWVSVVYRKELRRKREVMKILIRKHLLRGE